MSATQATSAEAEKKVNAFAGVFRAIYHLIARHFARRAAIKDIRQLNDWILRDIGIERDQIKGARHDFVDPFDRMRM